MVQRQKQPLWDARYEGMETNGDAVGSSSGVGSGSCICMYELFFHLPAPENKGSEASTNGPLRTKDWVHLHTLRSPHERSGNARRLLGRPVLLLFSARRKADG